MVVEVAFKLLIDNIEFVDKLFKLLNIVVDVVFKLLIDNIEFVDKLVKSVLNDDVEVFKVNIDVLLLFIEFNKDVDVEFKFDIDVLLLFIIFNNDVEVAFILLIDNIEFVDKLFKFVFVAYTVKSGLFVIEL